MNEYYSLLQGGEVIDKACIRLDKAKAEFDKGKFEKSFLKETEKHINSIKQFLLHYESEDENKKHDEFMNTITNKIMQHHFLFHMVDSLSLLEWETRKHCVSILETLLRYKQQSSFAPFVYYIQSNENIIPILIQGYRNHLIALNCGSMLRECAKHEALTHLIINTKEFYDFFEFVNFTFFDISSDAFITLKDILTRHKPIVTNFLEENHDIFFAYCENSLKSKNYVTRRQFIRLLGEILLDRSNIRVMMQYISNSHNLKTIMVLLKDDKISIQMEAFHLFKVFVANPHKTEPILKLLGRNKTMLLNYLQNFHVDKAYEEFEEEKESICDAIREIPDYPPSNNK